MLSAGLSNRDIDQQAKPICFGLGRCAIEVATEIPAQLFKAPDAEFAGSHFESAELMLPAHSFALAAARAAWATSLALTACLPGLTGMPAT